MVNIFDFKSYKTYLKTLTEGERGLLSRLAEAAECQKSYLSSCLKGKSHLSPDHVFRIAEYLQLNDQEQDFLFLLMDLEKAGDPTFKKKLELRIRNTSREAYRLKNQQASTVIINENNSGVGSYYSNWFFTAVHTLSSIGKFQSVAQISKRLNIDGASALAFLSELEKIGFVKKEKEAYKWHSMNLHLDETSPQVANHHLNWRLRAIENAQRMDRDASHYTSIQSMSLDDFEILRSKIAKFIKDFNKVSDPSTPEEAFCLSIDFFKI